MARANSSQQRLTLCTSCDEPLLLDVQTKSTSCPGCNSRVITESMKIKDYVAVRHFKVANHLVITKKGHVVAAVRADELEIDGRLRGSALALQGIRVGRRAHVEADLRSTTLVIEDGAEIRGHMTIGPTAVPELERVKAFAASRLPADWL
jgi:predicted RNA-binding Zn-ribbon protein involved in translation (DUF1610 family)